MRSLPTVLYLFEKWKLGKLRAWNSTLSKITLGFLVYHTSLEGQLLRPKIGAL